MHASREEKKSKKEENSSLLKNVGPTQRKLFAFFNTEAFGTDQELSEFMRNLMSAKTPQMAIALLKAETRDLEATFSDGCVHRFLSNGFLSLDGNRANPGGFTLFLFHPKTVPMGNKTFDQDTVTLREYFDLDVADTTVAYYAKQCYIHASNVHDLRVQLQMAKNFLELVTCPNSIATQGLNYILEPTHWRKMSTLIHNRFQTEKGFGSKFLYGIDRTVQIFLDRVTTTWDDYGQPNNLLYEAQELVDKVEDGLKYLKF